jgi:Raf kinase inhibitor-like YbhB/YbcL family protein
MALSFKSSAFSDGEPIPGRYTFDGEDISPPLEWSGEPPGTRSFALIIDDPDAPDPRSPQRTWVHWVVYNLTPDTHSLPAGAAIPSDRSGLNDWGNVGYGGPAPPIGRHRYVFKLYALDTVLAGLDRPTTGELEAAMAGHILEQARLVGTYQKRELHPMHP